MTDDCAARTKIELFEIELSEIELANIERANRWRSIFKSIGTTH